MSAGHPCQPESMTAALFLHRKMGQEWLPGRLGGQRIEVGGGQDCFRMESLEVGCCRSTHGCR